MMIKYTLVVTLLCLCMSCGTSSPELYSWKNYEAASYAMAKMPSEKHQQTLINTYEELINHPKGMRKMPPPGICAEYGYLLIKKGDVERGRKLLEQEVNYYPESAVFIGNLLKYLQQ